MIGWFEIPVTDIRRAKKFYDSVFEINVQLHDLGAVQMGWILGNGDNKMLGSLMQYSDAYKPSKTEGVLIYFTSDDVQNELDRITDAGGEILQPKTLVSPEFGYMALFLDTEGNRMALHSKQ
jgi:predicted enzyme related to lactoylglutathione lyase